MIQIDIDMPTDCASCWIRQNMGCKIANESGWLNNRRDDKCPLKEQEKPKTGHWIPIKSPTGVEAFGTKEMTVFDVCCSVCGAEEDVSFTGYKYCPRCGAKMEGR